MKTSRFLAVAAAFAAALPSSAAAAGSLFTDPEIIGVVSAANQGELDAAALAAGKTQNADVKGFAERMTKDHDDAKLKLAGVVAQAGLTPADTTLSLNLTKHASDEAAQLGYLAGKAFDSAYIDAQISDHATLLKELDERLIPDAKDANVAALLRKLRPVVAHHLAMARRVQAELAHPNQ
jgi:putative membrane protein